jgi:serine kinase of HPr protein (carbohydrate metabolism regulator)
MTLTDLVEQLDLKVYAGRNELSRPISGGYASDLLSDVIAHGQKDHLWVTLQIHPNIIAVAALKELAAIVLVNGREPAAETIERAQKERVPIFGTPLTAFEFVGRVYGLGIQGT